MDHVHYGKSLKFKFQVMQFNYITTIISKTDQKKIKIFYKMCGSCHLDRASNVEIGVECQIFVIVIFFNCGQVLQFVAHSRYDKGALTQKR